MPALHVHAAIRPKPEHFADALGAIREILPATRAEPGCLRFELLVAEGEREIHLVEAWTDAAALAAHHAAPYTRAVFARYGAWLAAPPALTRLRAEDLGPWRGPDHAAGG